MKNIIKGRMAKVMSVAMCLSAMLMVGVGAEDVSTATIMTSFTSGFTKLAGDALLMIAAIVPIALGVAGVNFLTRKAMGWFKGLAK